MQPDVGSQAVTGIDAADESRRPPLALHLLVSQRLGPGPELPYRLDLLARPGITLTWNDRRATDLGVGRVGAAMLRLEQATTPFVQAAAGWRSIVGSDAVVAMFESEGHLLALLGPLLRRGPRLVVFSCWLADLAVAAGPRRRRLYRRLYRHVDLVTVVSSNQVDTLVRELGIPRDRIAVVPFGVDLDELADVAPSENGRVAAIGRDLGRDWPTLLDAARGSNWGVDLATRPQQVAGLDLPDEVDLHGYVDRARYLEMLAGASVVAVPTHAREYPTGQTVLIEAMALGKACVVTDTPAMREYVTDERSALMVPLHDPVAWREATDRLLADPALRSRLGHQAAQDAHDRFGAERMWATVAGLVREQLATPRRRGFQR